MAAPRPVRRPTWPLAAFALGLATGPAPAADPRVPPLGREQTAEEKVASFRRARAGDAKALAALDAAGAAARDRVHAALLATEPAYAEAWAARERGQDDAHLWRKALDAAAKTDVHLRAHATYLLGRTLLAQGELEGAAGAFEAVRGRLRAGTPWTDEATLYLAWVHARLPELGLAGTSDRGRARRLLEALAPEGLEGAAGAPAAAPRYAEAPERVVEGARWLLRELRGEGSGPLLEIAKRMEAIEGMLDRARTGEPTREKQAEVVAALDRLIELMREKECGGGGGGGGGGQKPGQGGKPGGTGQPSGPAANSSLPGGEGGVGALTEGPRGPTSDAWGNLRDRDRDEAVQFLRERFPARYREIIERYYRGLAESDR